MDMGGLLQLLIALVLMGLFFWLILWFIDWVGLPEPFNKVAKVILGLFMLLYLLGILAGAAPPPTHYFWRR